MTIIISIRPKFCKEIYLGQKRVELRRKIGYKFTPGEKIYIYTSKSGLGITGEMIISSVQKMPVPEIEKAYLSAARIGKDEFYSYYQNCENGFVISLANVIEYKAPITLEELKLIGFRPPQSFMYPGDILEIYIESKICT